MLGARQSLNHSTNHAHYLMQKQTPLSVLHGGSRTSAPRMYSAWHVRQSWHRRCLLPEVAELVLAVRLRDGAVALQSAQLAIVPFLAVATEGRTRAYRTDKGERTGGVASGGRIIART